MPEPLFNKVARLRPATLLKKVFDAGVFHELIEVSKEHLSWVLLVI